MTNEELTKLLKKYKRAHDKYHATQTRPDYSDYAGYSERVKLFLPDIVTMVLKWEKKL